MEARGLRKPRAFMSWLAVVVSSFGILTGSHARPVSPAAFGGTPVRATARTSSRSQSGVGPL